MLYTKVPLMKRESNSHRLFGITRSKGKMYEFGLPEELHLSVPENTEPQELFLLTIGTLGDAAAAISNAHNAEMLLPADTIEELSFSASFFDAFIQSGFSANIEREMKVLAASSYYLAGRPGSSLVLARQIENQPEDIPTGKLLHWVLRGRWESYPNDPHPFFEDKLGNVARLLAFHFYDGSNLPQLASALDLLRQQAYQGATSRDLLFVDVIVAIVRLRISSSAWTTLPKFTAITADKWANAIRRPEFPKELWPSQILLGKAGLFSGESGIIQMPTSAGKTRSIEIILRSSFLAERTKLAVVVAPFRALCHEIGTSLRQAFREDNIKVNEFSDALQLDFLEQIAELFGSEVPSTQYILVLTPEKLLYVLRQTPSILTSIGLVIYDEGHQFDTGSRGITYELLLTEIKNILPLESQTILISAVIQNAQSIANWLIGQNAKVVNGTGLLPTSRAVAFASWIERLGQLMFFESNEYSQYDYFVPRVIERHLLNRREREKNERYFPENKNSNDIALYLGIRLASQGAVAVFCGRRDTASNMAVRAVEVYERGFTLSCPATSANHEEITRLNKLVAAHFGEQSSLNKAALLGIFVHHRTTPHGLRLAIEFAMQSGKINFVVCTSTLAQGINLPIRYLIVTSLHQGGERIRVRDFQNLVGRAGRSGMHTEGLVIFSDPEIFDERNKRQTSWKFRSSVELLSPERSEDTTSSLLGVLSPIKNDDGKAEITLDPESLSRLLLSDENVWEIWADHIVKANPKYKITPQFLLRELKWRRSLIFAIESYLMANRGSSSFDEFRTSAENLALSTLAYHLASDQVKQAITTLFTTIAEHIHQEEPSSEKQSIYSKTLLGIKSAKEIEEWVSNKRELLLTLESNQQWLENVWNLFKTQLENNFFHSVEPNLLAAQVAAMWISGESYQSIFKYVKAKKGSKQWGKSQRRALTEEDIMNFCEGILGFECSLILAAISQFLSEENEFNPRLNSSLSIFQKSLKYGLPDILSISCYELGFADRVISQELSLGVQTDGFIGNSFSEALNSHMDKTKNILNNYPSYFESVLSTLV
ncbi:DEAD/DEAH box helicase [Oxalobacter vibrioformis]|uniref:DEAD/DEAH box helicase n=1 Tax=Oxalobacter vibrioformis TaxID=933080 RepID=A0A9E9LWX9_9BURK|nr:DEAD/DEAH box helicase [Oxalobacter vibrioformis]WAW10369.1 DEAD/DEAH box helicase [Oxalobacter vibrioformis]